MIHTILFLDFLPDDLTTILIIAVILFLIAIFWSYRANKSRKNIRSRNFRERYYEKRQKK